MAPQLTDVEMNILALAWQCFSEAPKLDYDKLSKLCGHTNPRSTANAFANIKKKLAAISAENGGDDTTTTKTATSVKKTPATKAPAKPKANGAIKKRKASEDHEDEAGMKAENDTSEEAAPAVNTKSPAAKKRGRAAPKTKIPAKADSASEEEEGA